MTAMKQVAKMAFFQMMKITGLHRKALRQRAVMLFYHGFYDGHNQNPSWNENGKHLHVNRFRQQLQYLKANHPVLSLRDLLELLQQGKAMPDGAVILTIDDGYASNYELAFPLLQEFEIPASIYLTTDFVEGKSYLWTDRVEFACDHAKQGDYQVDITDTTIHLELQSDASRAKAVAAIKVKIKSMVQHERPEALDSLESRLQCRLGDGDIPDHYRALTWEQCKTMAASGLVELGSHTLSHPIVSRCEAEHMRQEVVASRKLIRDKAGVECLSFCYPNGQPEDYNEDSQKLVSESGYSNALTTVTDYIDKDSNPMELPRIYVNDKDNMQVFQAGIYSARSFKNVLKAVKRKG